MSPGASEKVGMYRRLIIGDLFGFQFVIDISMSRFHFFLCPDFIFFYNVGLGWKVFIANRWDHESNFELLRNFNSLSELFKGVNIHGRDIIIISFFRKVLTTFFSHLKFKLVRMT